MLKRRAPSIFQTSPNLPAAEKPEKLPWNGLKKQLTIHTPEWNPTENDSPGTLPVDKPLGACYNINTDATISMCKPGFSVCTFFVLEGRNMEQTQNKMAVMPVPKLVFSMALPLMLSLLIQSLYNIVDSIFVARLSEDALTATSLAYPVQFLMIALSVGTSVGLNALLSRLAGAGKSQEACRAATTGLVLNLCTALVFVIVGLTASGPLARAFTSDQETAGLCRQYMMVCMVFCPGIFLETQGQRMLQSVGFTTLSMVSLVCGAVTNIILDPIMIFGCLGCPAMGIKGAAIATVIGQWVGAAIALGLNRAKNPSVHIRLRGHKFRISDVASIYKVGTPTMVMQAMGSLMVASVNAVLIAASPTAVAFFGVYYKLQNFLMMPMNGLGQAAIPIVGFNYGAKNGGRIREAWRVMVPAAILFSVVGAAVFELLPAQLLSLFNASPAMLELGVPALRIIAVTFVLSSVTVICGYFVSGLGNGVVNMLGAAIRQFVLLAPFVWLFTRLFGVGAAWFALWISESAAFALPLFLTRRELKRKVDPIQAT